MGYNEERRTGFMEGVPSGVAYLRWLFPHMGALKHSCYFRDLR